MKSNRIWYQDGLRDGVPIALGYFAVAFTLGIAARNAGFSAFQERCPASSTTPPPGNTR